jgi:uncharacterized delta-60 repeat protein
MPPSKTVKNFHRYFVMNSGKSFSPGHALRIAALITMIAAPGVGLAQLPGSVDTNYPAGIGPNNADIRALTLQSDGKVLVGGNFTAFNGVVRTNIARLNSNGTLDTNFSANAQAFVGAIGEQLDGRILLEGFYSLSGSTNRIVRLNNNGTVDSSYTNFLGGADGFFQQIQFQPTDGKALIGGIFSSVNGTNRYRIARLNTNGSLDSGFTAPLVPGGFSLPESRVSSIIVLTNQNKILIGGMFDLGGFPSENRNIARLNLDGTIDTSFTLLSFTGGVFPNGPEVYSVAIQPDGKILCAGQFNSAGGSSGSDIIRLNTNGTVDSTFSTSVSGASGSISSVLVQPTGQILIGGSFTTINGVGRANLARLNPDGSLDTGFNVPCNNQVTKMVLQTNQFVVLSGSFSTVNGVAKSGLARVYAGLNPYDLCSPLPVPAEAA